jgi:Domain of unknown function (DUF4919)
MEPVDDMKIPWRLLLLLFASALVRVEATEEVAETIDWSAPANFGQLRHDYGWRDDYNAVCVAGRPSKELADSVVAREYQKTVELTAGWLQKCPVDIGAHLYRSFALAGLGRNAEATTHKKWVKGLLDSIFASGDGKTAETAYVTISVPEEYAVVGSLNLRVKSQGLLTNPLRDALTVTAEDGSERTIFFNPEAHFARIGMYDKRRSEGAGK